MINFAPGPSVHADVRGRPARPGGREIREIATGATSGVPRAVVPTGERTQPGERNGVGAMKIRASIRRICEHCKIVRRRRKLFVICKSNPKHKQRQG